MSFEKQLVQAPRNYDWAVLGPEGVVDLIKLPESEQSHFVTSREMLQTKARETKLIDERIIRHAFSFLTDHLDIYHSGDHAFTCSCPLRGWHEKGKGVQLDPDALLDVGNMLDNNPLALSSYHLWRAGAQNITRTADFLRYNAEQYSVK
jgi:hypothetical protein